MPAIDDLSLVTAPSGRPPLQRAIAQRFSAMATFGPHAMSDLSPLSGVKRKLVFGAVRSVFDPTATLAAFRHSTVKSQFCPNPNSRERSMGVLSSTPFQIL